MPTYTLTSSRKINAPALIAWAIKSYGRTIAKPRLLQLLVRGWPGVTPEAADELLSGAADYEVMGDAVVFASSAAAPSQTRH